MSTQLFSSQEALRDMLSKELNVSTDKITVIKSMLGGSFGAKVAAPYPEPMLGCLFARRKITLS